MRYFARFFENLQQDLKAFIYWCLVLIEILGEPGFKYSAMMPSVFANNEYVFNFRLLADGKGIFVQDKHQVIFYAYPIRKFIIRLSMV